MSRVLFIAVAWVPSLVIAGTWWWEKRHPVNEWDALARNDRRLNR